MSALELDVTMQSMRFADVPIVVRNERLSYSNPWSDGIFQDCLQSGYDCWLVKRGSQVLGHGILSTAVSESHLLNVCITPEHQGEGLGRVLVDYMLECARKKQSERVFLEVRPSNSVACALYQSMGFNQVGTRKGYYPGTDGREDALVLALEFV